jgi:hypothetical protein
MTLVIMTLRIEIKSTSLRIITHHNNKKHDTRDKHTQHRNKNTQYINKKSATNTYCFSDFILSVAFFIVMLSVILLGVIFLSAFC